MENTKTNRSTARFTCRLMFGGALLFLTSLSSFGQTSVDPGGDAFYHYLKDNSDKAIVRAYNLNPSDLNLMHCVKNLMILNDPVKFGLTAEGISQLQAQQNDLIVLLERDLLDENDLAVSGSTGVTSGNSNNSGPQLVVDPNTTP